MIFSLYLLSILYTNTMGLIIISKCKPIINHEIESKGYRIKEKDDTEFFMDILTNSVKFLIPGYFLKKAVNLTGKDYNINKIIKDKINLGEIIETESDVSVVDSIFKADPGKLNLSLGKYEKPIPYKSNTNTMYADERKFNDSEVDMDFWEEEENEIPALEEVKEETLSVKKEPLQEYLDSISEDELLSMAQELDRIRRLKKANESLLNDKAA